MSGSAAPMSIDRAEILALADRAEHEEWTIGDGPLVASLLRGYILVTDLLREKNASICRLQRLLFEGTSERRGDKDSEPTSQEASARCSAGVRD